MPLLAYAAAAPFQSGVGAAKMRSVARVTAFGDGPGKGELDKLEMTFGAALNDNGIYVDRSPFNAGCVGMRASVRFFGRARNGVRR